MPPPIHHDEVPLNAVVWELIDDIQAISFLAAGTSHAHWCVETSTDTLVWRQSRTKPFAVAGSRPDREVRVLQALQQHTWTPELITDVANVGMLLRYCPGTHPSPEQLNNQRVRAALLDHLCALWQTPTDVKPYHYESLIREYLERTPDPAANQDLAERLIQQAQWQVESFRLTHHDLHAENLLLDQEHWFILDWEYAGLANPWVDAVMLDRLLTLSAAEKHRLERVLPDIGGVEPWQEMREWLDGLDELWRMTGNYV